MRLVCLIMVSVAAVKKVFTTRRQYLARTKPDEVLDEEHWQILYERLESEDERGDFEYEDTNTIAKFVHQLANRGEITGHNPPWKTFFGAPETYTTPKVSFIKGPALRKIFYTFANKDGHDYHMSQQEVKDFFEAAGFGDRKPPPSPRAAGFNYWEFHDTLIQQVNIGCTWCDYFKVPV